MDSRLFSYLQFQLALLQASQIREEKEEWRDVPVVRNAKGQFSSRPVDLAEPEPVTTDVNVTPPELPSEKLNKGNFATEIREAVENLFATGKEVTSQVLGEVGKTVKLFGDRLKGASEALDAGFQAIFNSPPIATIRQCAKDIKQKAKDTKEAFMPYLQPVIDAFQKLRAGYIDLLDKLSNPKNPVLKVMGALLATGVAIGVGVAFWTIPAAAVGLLLPGLYFSTSVPLMILEASVTTGLALGGRQAAKDLRQADNIIGAKVAKGVSIIGDTLGLFQFALFGTLQVLKVSFRAFLKAFLKEVDDVIVGGKIGKIIVESDTEIVKVLEPKLPPITQRKIEDVITKMNRAKTLIKARHDRFLRDNLPTPGLPNRTVDYIAKKNKEADDLLLSLFEGKEQTDVLELTKAANLNLMRIFQEADIYSGAPLKSSAAIIAGKMKNSFELGQKSAFAAARKNTEKFLFGIPETVAGIERPTYGYFADKILPEWSPALKHYGDVQFKIKNSAKKFSTMTAGDSFVAATTNRPASLSIAPHWSSFAQLDLKKLSHTTRNPPTTTKHLYTARRNPIDIKTALTQLADAKDLKALKELQPKISMHKFDRIAYFESNFLKPVTAENIEAIIITPKSIKFKDADGVIRERFNTEIKAAIDYVLKKDKTGELIKYPNGKTEVFDRIKLAERLGKIKFKDGSKLLYDIYVDVNLHIMFHDVINLYEQAYIKKIPLYAQKAK